MGIKFCIVCGKEFECYDKVQNKRRAIYKRPINAKTCSKKCSRLYIDQKSKKSSKKIRNKKT